MENYQRHNNLSYGISISKNFPKKRQEFIKD